jgi:ankyrin repeat protein
MPPLCEAAWRGDLQAAQRLVESGVSLEEVYQEQTPLMWAAKMGHPDVVSLLIQHGADVSRTIDGWTAIRWAAASGDPGVVAALLFAGADPHTSDDGPFGTILHLAALHDDGDLIVMLAEAGALLDEPSQDPGGTPLHVAALDGNAEAVRALLALGANPVSTGPLGRSPLHVACVGGHVRVVEDLLRAGADSSSRDDLGLTPLHLAAMEGHERVIGQLLYGGGPVSLSDLRSAQDDRGWSAAHYAAAFGHTRCLTGLIGANASPDVRNDYGSTPLHWACTSGDIETITFLVQSGADPSAVDFAGRTPFQRWGGSLPAFLEAGLNFRPPAEAEPLTSEIDAQSTDTPILVAYQNPEYTIHAVSGLLLAVWKDGIVLFCADPGAPGKDLRVSRIATEEAADFTNRLAEVGFFDLQDTKAVQVHASSVRILAEHDGKHIKHEWDEILVPYVAPWYPDSVERTFTMIWLLAKRCISSVQRLESLPLDTLAHNGSFRGYDLDRPHATSWIR